MQNPHAWLGLCFFDGGVDSIHLFLLMKTIEQHFFYSKIQPIFLPFMDQMSHRPYPQTLLKCLVLSVKIILYKAGQNQPPPPIKTKVKRAQPFNSKPSFNVNMFCDQNRITDVLWFSKEYISTFHAVIKKSSYRIKTKFLKLLFWTIFHIQIPNNPYVKKNRLFVWGSQGDLKI